VCRNHDDYVTHVSVYAHKDHRYTISMQQLTVSRLISQSCRILCNDGNCWNGGNATGLPVQCYQQIINTLSHLATSYTHSKYTYYHSYHGDWEDDTYSVGRITKIKVILKDISIRDKLPSASTSFVELHTSSWISQR